MCLKKANNSRQSPGVKKQNHAFTDDLFPQS